MEQSAVLDQLHILKTNAEYVILLTKMRLLNEIAAEGNVFTVNYQDNILCTEEEINSQSIEAYSAITDRARLTLTIVFCKNKYELPDVIDEKYSNIEFISLNLYDELYENLCNRLNDMEEKYPYIKGYYT